LRRGDFSANVRPAREKREKELGSGRVGGKKKEEKEEEFPIPCISGNSMVPSSNSIDEGAKRLLQRAGNTTRGDACAVSDELGIGKEDQRGGVWVIFTPEVEARHTIIGRDRGYREAGRRLDTQKKRRAHGKVSSRRESTMIS